MAVVELSLKALGVLDDGRIRAAFEQELKHVILDLEDRPGDHRAREVSLKVQFKPHLDEAGQIEQVATQVQIGSKLPSRKTQVYSMKPRKSQKGPMLVFNELSLDNVNQDTLPFDDPE